MFNHAIRHPVKKALTDIRNHSELTPLTLAAKLGRKELFLQCLELSHVVESTLPLSSTGEKIRDAFDCLGNLALFKYQVLHVSSAWY